MKQINDYQNVQANDGEFRRPAPEAYFLVIKRVEDVPLNPNTGRGDYLKIEYDIKGGEFDGFYQSEYDRTGKWYGSLIRSYKEKALGMFKHFIQCVEESNDGYKWDWNEQGLAGKVFGAVLGEEEYMSNAGEVRRKLVVRSIKTVKQLADGDYKVPELKKLPQSDVVSAPIATADDDCPF